MRSRCSPPRLALAALRRPRRDRRRRGATRTARSRSRSWSTTPSRRSSPPRRWPRRSRRRTRTSRSRSRRARRAATATTSSRPGSPRGEMTDVFMYNSGSLFQALKPGEEPRAADRRAVGQGPRRRVQADACRRTTRSTARRSAAPSAAASSTTSKVYDEARPRGPEDLGRVHGEQRQDQGQAGIDPVIQTYGETWTSQLFVLGRLPQRRRRRPGLGREVHGEPGQVRAGAGARGLPAPRGGQQGRLPEQGLRARRSSTTALQRAGARARARTTRC